MHPKNTKLDKTGEPEEPLENLPEDSSEEDIEIAGRKPDLGEIDEDSSEF
jgi:hypothetical protein